MNAEKGPKAETSGLIPKIFDPRRWNWNKIATYSALGIGASLVAAAMI